MDATLAIVVVTIIIALAFDVINGFHDAANSIATVVSTRVLSPKWAVLWAAFFNFIAMFVFQAKVATTIAKTVKIQQSDSAFVTVVLAGLIGAIVWDLITWWWGLPTSSSHALIGGLAGAGVAHAGWNVLNWKSIQRTLAWIPAAPLIGFGIALILFIGMAWLFRRWRPGKVEKLFKKLQLVSASLYSLGHGGNDAQKTMGVIVAVLVAGGYLNPDVEIAFKPGHHWWIIVACHAAMGLGTAFGGWRIVKTMGMKITKLGPPGGFCAETAGAITLFGATHLGIPVSTTHTITGSIVGVGVTTRASSVRWGVAGRIVMAWLVTIPASALVAAVSYWALHPFLSGIGQNG